jgi:hypothetical protein
MPVFLNRFHRLNTIELKQIDMTLKKIDGSYVVNDVNLITSELESLFFEVTGDIEDLVLYEKNDLHSSTLVIGKFYENSCFDTDITQQLFLISQKEQIKLLHECMNTQSIQDIFTGGNLGDLVNTMLGLVFLDFTKLQLTKYQDEDIREVNEFGISSIHGYRLPYCGEPYLINKDELLNGCFSTGRKNIGGNLHTTLFCKQIERLKFDYLHLLT